MHVLGCVSAQNMLDRTWVTCWKTSTVFRKWIRPAPFQHLSSVRMGEYTPVLHRKKKLRQLHAVNDVLIRCSPSPGTERFYCFVCPRSTSQILEAQQYGSAAGAGVRAAVVRPLLTPAPSVCCVSGSDLDKRDVPTKCLILDNILCRDSLVPQIIRRFIPATLPFDMIRQL